MRMHHAAILTRDVDASLTFWRDGLGLEQRMFLVSFNVDLDATLARLAELGLGGLPRQTVNTGERMVVVRDPDGVRVELIDLSVMPDMSQTCRPS